MALTLTVCMKRSAPRAVLDNLSRVRTERDELREDMEARQKRVEAVRASPDVLVLVSRIRGEARLRLEDR